MAARHGDRQYRALSMAAVLSLPSGFPHRDRLVTIVFGVTFVTLMTQALPLRRFLRLLKVTTPSEDASIDRAKMMLIAARRGQTELDELLAAGLVSRTDHAERRALFQRQVIEAEAALRSRRGGAARGRVVGSPAHRPKAAVDASLGLIGHEVADVHVNEIDRALLDLSSHSHGGET
jgi:CPA1 family monovalent cation:H+ antiporter